MLRQGYEWPKEITVVGPKQMAMIGPKSFVELCKKAAQVHEQVQRCCSALSYLKLQHQTLFGITLCCLCAVIGAKLEHEETEAPDSSEGNSKGSRN